MQMTEGIVLFRAGLPALEIIQSRPYYSSTSLVQTRFPFVMSSNNFVPKIFIGILLPSAFKHFLGSKIHSKMTYVLFYSLFNTDIYRPTPLFHQAVLFCFDNFHPAFMASKGFVHGILTTIFISRTYLDTREILQLNLLHVICIFSAYKLLGPCRMPILLFLPFSSQMCNYLFHVSCNICVIYGNAKTDAN